MSQESVERLLGRMITDERFRSSAMTSLENCCACHGFVLSQAELEHLADLDYRLLGFVSSTLNDSIRRH